MSVAPTRQLLTAELLSIGSELTVGDTRDTNAGELARGLTTLGVQVLRLTALPDEFGAVTEAFEAGLRRADLVISTGGLGPTPDDLTREAIAAACGETPTVDPGIETWLRELWRRRGMDFPELNLKQAWRIPSAVSLPNPNGTAPGWLVDRTDGRVVVALPGPPREMRPMWADQALPRLRGRLGADVATRTYRLTGIGESQLADVLGERLRTANPVIATYARVEAVDVRISATADPPRTAAEIADEGAAAVLELVGSHVWATGDTTWSQAIGERLAALGWTLAAVEIETAASFAGLLGDVPWFRFGESLSADAPAAVAGDAPASAPRDGATTDDAATADAPDLIGLARRARDLGGTEVGVAIRARPRTDDMAVSIALATPSGERTVRRIVFQTGPLGRSRAALAAAAVVLEALGEAGQEMVRTG